MNMGGYTNRVAWVDLTTGSVDYRPIAEEDARKYIGARGLGVKYVFDNGPQVDALSPENILCFMNGPLTGTDVNLSGRMAVVTKSPLTDTITDSHHGGWSAARLKWAGFDGLVFKGKAEKPVYAYVEKGQVTLYDASDLWGKHVHETIQILQERHGGPKDLSVITIGPAGENLVKFGCWMNENDRASGRGGTGCVGGSKHLKAIVIKGDHADRPRPADKEAFKAAQKVALQQLMDDRVLTSPRKGGLSVYGTNVLMNITSTMGALPVRNGQVTSFGEHADLLSGEHVKATILVNDPTCHACPVACKKEVDVTEGPFKVHMESVEYEPAWSLGAFCGNDDVAAVAYLIDRANDYGFDAIEIGTVMAMYMEVTQRGYANGEGLAWGDTHAMVEMARKIAFREGVGNILAEGTGKAAALLGHPELGMHAKGQGIPAYDPRGIKGMGLGYATSNRGACHLRGYSPAAEVAGNVLGPGGKVDPLAWEGKGNLLFVFQNVHAMTDCLDVCKFATFAESLDSFAAQFAAITGAPCTAADLLTAGERVYNLERYYNNLNGFREGSDTLPKRFLEEASTMPGSDGHVCELDKMLEEYYQVRGWVNGVVPEAKLKELQIL
ncbi:aldehyde ferredoxin oxidoreductase family protein [Candidatus Amarolinea aalborgensis]|uniref:aldehyde ferredoxin oxidoreductase family protein n=1 Tax=Candidatus Amarolinea aalborgensis TaxID=2249329 RepID=UPI003BF9EED5